MLTDFDDDFCCLCQFVISWENKKNALTKKTYAKIVIKSTGFSFKSLY